MARTEIEIAYELLDQLSASFCREEYWDHSFGLMDDSSIATFVVDRVSGLSVKIWADEHPPPHFHVNYQGQDASFSILDCARLPGSNGLERYEHKIHSWWGANRELLIEIWNRSRPTDCPVGPINSPPQSI